MTRATISGISPFFVGVDVAATLSFYHDMPGFDVTFRGPEPEHAACRAVVAGRDE